MNYSFLDALFDPAFVIDSSHIIIFSNESGAKLLDTSIKRMVGKKKLAELASLFDADFNAQLKSLVPGKSIELKEIEIKTHTGNSKKAQFSAQGFEDKGNNFTILIAREVTLEEVLHEKYKKELEQKEEVIYQLEKAKQELENYSKNLEQMVSDRTKELRSVNQMLSAVMNSLGQGFITFAKDGQCSNIYTKACLDVLEANPSGKRVWDVLKYSGKEKEHFIKWMDLAFQETLPFESLTELAPSIYNHSQGRTISLSFFPIRSEEEGSITDLVMVSTDKTEEKAAKEALEKEKGNAQLIMKMIQHRAQFKKFLDSFVERLEQLKALSSQEPTDTSAIFRSLHTIEGEAGLFGLMNLRATSRKPQELLEEYKSEGKRIDANAKRVLLTAIIEMKLSIDDFKTSFAEALSALRITDGEWIEAKRSHFEKVLANFSPKGFKSEWANEILEELDKVPIASKFAHFNEVCEMVAFKQGKEISPIVFSGDEVLISPNEYSYLLASMVHAFRNIVDHGIESPDEREMSGKSRAGKIEVRFENKGSDLLIQVADDGAGVDPSRIRKKLKEKIPDKDFSQESDSEVIQHIFDPSFSTRDEVSEFSGRGVGMDAIRTEVQNLGGSVRVESTLGEGTRLMITIPTKSSPNSQFNKSA